MIPALVLAILWRYHNADESSPTQLIKRLALWPQLIVFFLLLCLFLGCYRMLYLPYNPGFYSLPAKFFPLLILVTLLSSAWVAGLKDSTQYIKFVWVFCMGATMFGVITIGASIALETPLYYGKLVNILTTKIFIARSFINSPGVANLLCFFPNAFIAGFLLKKNQRPWGFWPLGLVGLALSLWAAMIIDQRSYFVITFLICPTLVSIFLIFQLDWRGLVFTIFLLGAYSILWSLNESFFAGFLARPVTISLLHDTRFEMLFFWIRHLINDPFARILVGPEQWKDLLWFHNFFADVHRLSGFWALSAAVLLVGYIFFRLLMLIRFDRAMGLFLMAIAIPMLLIMCTSVVPEGERQPLFLLIFIGIICEKLLATRKKILAPN
jgi:hypothetical protein